MSSRAASRQSAEVLHSDRDVLIGAWREMYVAVFRCETTVDGVTTLSRLFDERAREFPEGLGFLTVVDQGAALPDTRARAKLAAFMGASKSIRVSAVVFEGSGFRNAAVRGVVTGLTLLARQPFPHRVFSSVEEASQWLCGQGPTRWRDQSRAFSEAVAALRALPEGR
jgi:hypothetical protein